MLVDRVSFSVAAGEVLGLAGLLGAGRTETLEVLFGLHPEFGGGEVSVNGRRVSLRNPVEAKQHGIALVTEDRKRDGLILGAGIDRNAELTVMSSISNFGVVSNREEREVALRTMRQLAIHASGPEQVAGTLSGGNQQKLVIGKWLQAVSQNSASGRADSRDRCRGKGRHLPPDSTTRRGGPGDRAGLVGIARTHPVERPYLGLARRPPDGAIESIGFFT